MTRRQAWCSSSSRVPDCRCTHEELARDAGVDAGGTGFRGFTLAHNEPSPAEVDRVFAEAIAAGAKPVKVPQPVFWGGYSGYFADPDGFLWEIAHNPFTDLT